jgi:hypothetical protein
LITDKNDKINKIIMKIKNKLSILELFHLIIPNRGFERTDLFGNIVSLLFAIVIYKVKNRYV